MTSLKSNQFYLSVWIKLKIKLKHFFCYRFRCVFLKDIILVKNWFEIRIKKFRNKKHDIHVIMNSELPFFQQCKYNEVPAYYHVYFVVAYLIFAYVYIYHHVLFLFSKRIVHNTASVVKNRNMHTNSICKNERKNAQAGTQTQKLWFTLLDHYCLSYLDWQLEFIFRLDNLISNNI